MLQTEFNLPVSVETAPKHTVCSWCSQPALHLLTAIGGPFHNVAGLFCSSCAHMFIQNLSQAFLKMLTR